MSTSLFRKLGLPLAMAAVLPLAGCGLIKDPPTQLEARLQLAAESVKDRKALAKHIVGQLGIAALKPDNVRVVHDSDKKAHFFRVVGKEALPSELLKQVSAGLAKLNEMHAWQGKLEILADADMDGFLKTSKREFPVRASWHSAQVDAYLVQSAFENQLAAQMARLAQAAGERSSAPKTVACMLSFAPQEPLPELKGETAKMFPAQGSGMSVMQRAGMLPREMTVPHNVTLTHPELTKMEAPVVQDGKLLFRFALIEDANVTVIGGTYGDTKPITIDHGAIELCQRKLRDGSPSVQRLIDSAALLAEVKSIGPAQLVALPKAQ